MTSSETATRNGTSLGGVVQIVFLILKLTGLVDWSWPVVLLPLEISGALFLLIFLGFLVYLVVKND